MEPTRRSYGLAFTALIALSLLTLGLSFVPLGGAGIPLALGIAAGKAVLVALFFMHLVEQRAVNALVPVVVIVLVALFVGITAGEVAARQDPRDDGARRSASEAPR